MLELTAVPIRLPRRQHIRSLRTTSSFRLRHVPACGSGAATFQARALAVMEPQPAVGQLAGCDGAVNSLGGEDKGAVIDECPVDAKPRKGRARKARCARK